MRKYTSISLAVLLSSLTILPAHATPDSPSGAQGPQTKAEESQPTTGAQGTAGASTSVSAANSSDCPPAMNHEAAERLEPPGPIGESGTASAIVNESGTIGSTGATRASTMSGATGTTGEYGSYTQDPSGSVTTAGATGAPIDSSVECLPQDGRKAAGTSGQSAIENNAASGGTATTQPVQQGQPQADKPVGHSEPRQ